MPAAASPAGECARMQPAPASRELHIALAIACALVVLRSLVFLVFEQSFFDSDQAIVGLMAKHLSEGRAFPLFFYGQLYMLAVEAWLAVPIFWIAGPTVAALRTSLILTNLAAAALLIGGLSRGGRLRPLLALVAALFFVFPVPGFSARLVEAQGGNIEPFVYVLLLWFVRERPFLFGSILAVGFAHREITLAAVPVLFAGQLAAGALARSATWRNWLFVAVAFAAVSQGIDALKPYADLRGPGSRGAWLGPLAASRLPDRTDRINVTLSDTPKRAAMFVRAAPNYLTAHPETAAAPDWRRDWPGLAMAMVIVVGLGRIAVLTWPRRRAGPRAASPFGWYVLGVGALAAAAYVTTQPAFGHLVLRYALLVVYVPIGVTAVWLTLEPWRAVRRAVVAAVLVWGVASAAAHWRYAWPYWHGLVPNEPRAIVDGLRQHGVHVVESTYWRAYKLTFLSEERVIVSSVDYVRIDEYQRLAGELGEALPWIQEETCPGGTPVGTWFLCRRQ